ncbi:unnamed protein product [Ilex paraguariensis]|uniref:Uncharacterized protein n=1 Tax=Ilex paraguariensis TaxID=185542 RepID=A0ABC8UUJ6_9AQUA
MGQGHDKYECKNPPPDDSLVRYGPHLRAQQSVLTERYQSSEKNQEEVLPARDVLNHSRAWRVVRVVDNHEQTSDQVTAEECEHSSDTNEAVRTGGVIALKDVGAANQYGKETAVIPHLQDYPAENEFPQTPFISSLTHLVTNSSPNLDTQPMLCASPKSPSKPHNQSFAIENPLKGSLASKRKIQGIQSERLWLNIGLGIKICKVQRREDGFHVVREAVDSIRGQEESVSITVQDENVRVMQNDVEIKGDRKEHESPAGRKSVHKFRGIKSTKSGRST